MLDTINSFSDDFNSLINKINLNKEYDKYDLEEIGLLLYILGFSGSKIETYLKSKKEDFINENDFFSFTNTLLEKQRLFYDNKSIYSDENFKKIIFIIEILGDIFGNLRMNSKII